jgi:hypothetical protein
LSAPPECDRLLRIISIEESGLGPTIRHGRPQHAEGLRGQPPDVEMWRPSARERYIHKPLVGWLAEFEELGHHLRVSASRTVPTCSASLPGA